MTFSFTFPFLIEIEDGSRNEVTNNRPRKCESVGLQNGRVLGNELFVILDE